MKPPAPLRRLFFPFLLLFTVSLAAADRPLPTSNPYRGVIERIEALSPDERATFDAWISPEEGQTAPVLTETQRAFVRELSTAVIEAAAAPDTSAADWDTSDPADDPMTATIPSVGPMRQLSRLVIKDADELPASEALAHYGAVAQFGRRQREGGSLIQQLTGCAIEGIAQAGVARRLTDFSGDELALLARDWSALKPSPTLAEAFAGERDKFFRPLIDRCILPGLRELLAEDDAAETNTETADAGEGFSRDLRLSALVDLGAGERHISLENTRTGEVVTLRPGETEAGITLVRLDFDQRIAILRSGEEEAVVNLRSKRIVPRGREIARLRALFDGQKVFSDKDEVDSAYRELVARVRQHQGGPEGYVETLYAEYQRTLDAQIASADSPRAPRVEPTPPANHDPFVALVSPTFGRVGRTLHNLDTQAVMLQAAVHSRLVQLGHPAGEAPAPADPWDADGGGFTATSTPDGGFVLRSRYEMCPDAPLTYKFAAPDAGFVRQK